MEEKSQIEQFLEAVKQAFPNSEPKVAWQLASYQIEQEFCSIKIDQESRTCGLQKVDGLCPYHLDSKKDFFRQCQYISDDGDKCYKPIYNRDLAIVWCYYHLKPKKPDYSLKRAGDYIVIKDTPYAISDDMTSIIGRVVSDVDLNFSLVEEVDPRMKTVADYYGLLIRLGI